MDIFTSSRVKAITWFTVTTGIVLILLVLVLGWQSSEKVQEIVVADFNQQQLILARHASQQIDISLDSLKREMQVLSIAPVIQYAQSQPVQKLLPMQRRLLDTYAVLKEKDVLSIDFITQTKTHTVDSLGYKQTSVNDKDAELLDWAGKSGGQIHVSEITNRGGTKPELSFKTAIAVLRTSTDETHPDPSGELTGVLVFTVNANTLAATVTKNIVSGKTGYAWVIDNQGDFLYHPKENFISKNAFQARKEEKAAISFEQINRIQKDYMLAGKEGISWYYSGWHRTKQMEMKKLIAYSPVYLDDNNPANLWSVAVVAPMSEVKDAISAIQLRQFVLEGLILAVILFGSLLKIRFMFGWSKSLQKEVDARTRELKKSMTQYRSLVENACDTIFTVDRNKNILSMNTYGYTFFKKDTESKGEKQVQAFFGTKPDTLQEDIKRAFESSCSVQNTISVRIDSTEYWLNFNLSPMLDENNNVYAILGIARDITENIRLKDKLSQTEKLTAMVTIVAGVAHEVNNPLTIILGFTDMIKEKVARDSETYQILSTIEKQGYNIKKIVDNLLCFSGASESYPMEVDINSTLNEILSLLELNFSAKNIHITKKFQTVLPAVLVDKGEIQQVFLNLISNAKHAMYEKGGVLTISTATTTGDKFVEVRISDTGCGIEKVYRLRIFDPLFSTKVVGEGTGMGLSVSYGIITKYGGTITFETSTEDEGPETGTTFIITIPVAPPN